MEQRQKGSDRNYRKRKIIAFICTTLALWGIAYVSWLRPAQEYYQAQNLYRDGRYQEAQRQFASIHYKDSEQMAEKSGLFLNIQKADTLITDGRYDDADTILRSAEEDEDDQVRKAVREEAQYLNYSRANAALAQGDYKEAKRLFDNLGNYRDSIRLSRKAQNKSDLDRASGLLQKKQYKEAGEIAKSLLRTGNDDIDSSAQNVYSLSQHGQYEQAVEQMSRGNYSSAGKTFEALGDYEDSEELLKEAREDNQNGVYSDRAIIRDAERFLSRKITVREDGTAKGDKYLANTTSLYGHSGSFMGGVSKQDSNTLSAILFYFNNYSRHSYDELYDSLVKDFGTPMKTVPGETSLLTVWQDRLYDECLVVLYLKYEKYLWIEAYPQAVTGETASMVTFTD